MIRTLSHLVVATEDVARIARFFKDIFQVEAHYEQKEFAEFVLPSGFRIAFFRPVGKAAEYFTATGERGVCSFGVTVEDVDAFYAKLDKKLRVSGPPKTHPWGEKSFLLVDCDGNRWEVTQSPSPSGMLVEKVPVVFQA